MINPEKITIPYLRNKKVNNQPITMLTAYDYPSAQLVDRSGMDIILVGDSLAMTVMGYPNTVSVTMDEMIHHCKMVARGTEHAFLIGDMPFMSYQTGPTDAIRNAGRFLKEGGMEAVKLEGGMAVTEVVKAIVGCGISVMGHIGLTPQSATKLGGYRVQGKTADAAQLLIADARALQDAGCFAIVLEAVPAQLAEIITAELYIPTIGIGAGKNCDGQVLVYHDLLGLYQHPTPKFVKQYANLNKTITDAVKQYCLDVQQRNFPTEEHGFKMNSQELKKIKT
ncbi:MAG: 3-methyl-2-oxobutanoate hydroxymethyltransferase [Calditrichales bacterium]|nr:MAG: 3-methyl-2-oxobutanoate hydroxymethyltransferase [Calditrichales bacterium]